jgi:hypothetical protein
VYSDPHLVFSDVCSNLAIMQMAHARAFQESSWARRSAEEQAANERLSAEKAATQKLVEESRARRAAEDAQSLKAKEAALAKVRTRFSLVPHSFFCFFS